MGLTTRLAGQVDSQVRERGRQYYQQGAVQIVRHTISLVAAKVRGSKVYEVVLEPDGESLVASCTCPFVAEGAGACKHIWATILACEASGYLRDSGQPEIRFLDVDDPEAGDADHPGDWHDDDPEDDDYDDFDEDTYSPRYVDRPAYRRPVQQTQPRRKRAPANWKKALAGLRSEPTSTAVGYRQTWPAGRQLLYVIDLQASQQVHGLVLEVPYRQRKKDGDWSMPKTQRIPRAAIPLLEEPADRQILALLGGAREHFASSYHYYNNSSYDDYESMPIRFQVPTALQPTLLPLLCGTERCFLRQSERDPEQKPLHWDDGPAWEFRLQVVLGDSRKQYLILGELQRGQERMSLTTPTLFAPGLVFWNDRVGRLEAGRAADWIALLRRDAAIPVPVKQKDELIKELLRLPHLPRLQLPPELRVEEVAVVPRPRLRVRAPQRRSFHYGSNRVQGELSFDYDGLTVAAADGGRGIYQPENRCFILRDPAAESAAAQQLEQLGFKTVQSYYAPKVQLELAPRHLPKTVRTLLQAGWHVEADGKLYRRPGDIHIEVRSGVDWFDLHGTVQFGDTVAHLPALLAALQKGEDTVKLGDGTFGMLPEDWLKKYGQLAGLGTPEGENLRFRRNQVGLLDALLASQPEATCDKAFRKLRDELQQFAGIQAADAPPDFVGELRGYQTEGLGWLHFLQKFGFGGCLADDMGLGKTVQVLALLESRRALRARSSAKTNGSSARLAPSLVVVPRSLVFNWIQEAARFTPQLRILDHTGMNRGKTAESFADFDVVLTTYGTLRRDALLFKDVQFDYGILDESQAVKNPKTDSAKAVRLLQANHRLALSGTPIENHLGELWSLFEFLNPGMLGRAAVFAGGLRNPTEESRALLARAIRPFILRRTKEQVARDLPAKLEQTIYCELEPAQRKQYDALRQHYRQALLAKVERDGVNRSKIQILEALLRLRQAACHPGLIDKAKTTEPSAKLDMLMPSLAEVMAEGHKVLVFSQFTSLLAIVRQRLDKGKIAYEYLDGQTRDRQGRVEHFQTDPDCKLFLISLKAGGLGLNLTAAEYVFLLDPWWKPAVEAQAIDRAHRIGQARQVFAYRLIAKDTVEEKVLELQKSKRALADAIINADNSLIRNLGREDLELLLS